MSYPKKFCSAPFRTAIIDRDGAMLPCCEFISEEDKKTFVKDAHRWWTRDLNVLRKQMIAGTPPSECNYCLDKESTYGQSVRLETNSRFPDVIATDTPTLKEIEIRVSNYCNLKCTMCGPYASSSIAVEQNKNREKLEAIGIYPGEDKTVRWWEDETAYNNLIGILSNVDSVFFSGGEPLIVPETIKIIESLSANTHIRINTNLTTITDRFINAIQRFDRVEIIASLEGVGKHNDYVRYPSRWQEIHSNIQKLKSLNNVKLSIHHVLQHTSLYSLPDFLQYIDEQNFHVHFSEIYYGSLPSPGVLSIDSAPHSDVEQFRNWYTLSKYEYPVIEQWVGKHNYNNNLHEKFKTYMKTLDTIRNLNFDQTFEANFSVNEKS